MNLPETWTAIAEEDGVGRWIPVPNAPMTLKEAQALLMEGHILMAQRRASWSLNNRWPPMQVVIKKAGK